MAAGFYSTVDDSNNFQQLVLVPTVLAFTQCWLKGLAYGFWKIGTRFVVNEKPPFNWRLIVIQKRNLEGYQLYLFFRVCKRGHLALIAPVYWPYASGTNYRAFIDGNPFPQATENWFSTYDSYSGKPNGWDDGEVFFAYPTDLGVPRLKTNFFPIWNSVEFQPD